MIIAMKPHASQAQIDQVCNVVKKHGLECHLSTGSNITIIGVIGDKSVLSGAGLECLEGVRELIPVSESYKLAGRTGHPDNTVVDIAGAPAGADELFLIAGPCAVESYEQMHAAATALAKTGLRFLRGGAYKPRTSPYSFQGLEEDGLKILAQVGRESGLKIVTEAIDDRSTELVCKYADVVQIGSRNMQNFHLLREVGKCGKPVILKRGLSSTIDEWLNAAEYIMSSGNANVILCERGIRTFETATRNTLDISAVPVLKSKTHLPIIVDPSHASGSSSYIAALSRCAIAAGADGLIIEVHPAPETARSDGAQSLNPEEYTKLHKEIAAIAHVMGRVMPGEK